MGPVKILINGGDFWIMQDAAAVLAGVTVQTLINWHKQENPPPRNPDGSYSARDFGQWLVEHRGQKKRGPKPKDRPEDGADESYAEAERRLKLAQAIKVERENEVAVGKLVELDVLEPAWQAILMRVRSRLLALPTAMAQIVVGDTSVHSIQCKLKEAVHDALSELADDWRDGEQADDSE